MHSLAEKLADFAHFESVIKPSKPYKKLDFSDRNALLLDQDLSETAAFSDFVFDKMLENNAYTGIGGYAENRVIYRSRKHFNASDEPRSIHLGTDVWVPAGEPVYAPMPALVHSFAFNNHYGDYGPTIILSHEVARLTFYTLYGHLSLSSLEYMFIGKNLAAGEPFANVGNLPENGDWPPHLHFQIIADMGDHAGDFPGVSSIRDQALFLSICPDPNLMLRIPENAS